MLKTKFPTNPYDGMIFYSINEARTYEFLKDFNGIEQIINKYLIN